MDFYSKVFVCNLVVIIFACWFDFNINNDRIQNTLVIGFLFSMWAFLSFISIPAYIVYYIVVYL